MIIVKVLDIWGILSMDSDDRENRGIPEFD